MFGLAQRVALSAGWRRRGLAFLAGGVGALALAPVGFFPAMVVPMSAAVWFIDGADVASSPVAAARGAHLWPTLRAAAATGWWWGFGYFVAGLWWLGAACLVEPDKFAWALPISVLGVPAILGLFSGFGFLLARLLWVPGPGRVLSLAVGLTVSEYLRGALFTGFPWNDYGMALGTNLMLAQSASLAGLHGLTLLAVAVFAAPATLADEHRTAGFAGAARWTPLLAACLVLFGDAGFGAARLSRGQVADVPGVRLRIMQPDVAQDAAFDYTNRHEILARYLALSDKATSSTASGLADVTHLIWPESPFPFILSRESEALDAISAALPAGTVLVTGAVRVEGQPGSSSPPRYYNSVQVLTNDGSIVDTYDKVHLVPFGEYLPFQAFLGHLGIQHFVHIPGGFEAGTRHRLLGVPGLPPVVPAICYEAIFPDEMAASARRPASQGMILNLTNDGWFGKTSGPYQHLAQARLRAIEQGLPLVRAANTGISAIIDPYGRITASLPLGTANVLDGALPEALPRTLFSRLHEIVALALGLGMILVVFVLKVWYFSLGSRQGS